MVAIQPFRKYTVRAKVCDAQERMKKHKCDVKGLYIYDRVEEGNKCKLLRAGS